MISTLMIVFRETLEAALIVLAASKGISGRAGWVAGGVAAGLCGAAIVAFFTSGLSDLFDGNGTEVLNAVVLVIAVVMLAWQQIWMSAHAAELVGESRAVGKAVREGAKPRSALAIICAVAGLREGSETVLFLYGIAIDGQYWFATMLQACWA